MLKKIKTSTLTTTSMFRDRCFHNVACTWLMTMTIDAPTLIRTKLISSSESASIFHSKQSHNQIIMFDYESFTN